MASGNVLDRLSPQSWSPTNTVPAQTTTILGASTPAEVIPVLAFDTSTVEYADFHNLVMPPHYGGGGVTLTIFSSCGTTTGGIAWEVAFRRIADDAEDLDTTAQTYDYNTLAIATLPSAVGEITVDTLTFTNGADMDSVVAGDLYTLRIRRATGNATDTATTDAFLHAIVISET